MPISRAVFLKACGVALLGARVEVRALVSSAATASTSVDSRPAGPFRLQDATPSLFQPYVNTGFAVRTPGGAHARFVLAKVVERPVSKNVAQFSLIFHAAAGETVRDGTHAVQHPAFGAFDLFLVPIGAPNDRRTVYQACFSRHLSSLEAGAGCVSASPCWRT